MAFNRGGATTVDSRSRTTSTSLYTRASSATASSASSAGKECASDGRETKRRRLNTEVGVEGGVGVFGGDPLEETFGDPHIDQLVHQKYKARMMSSKSRSSAVDREGEVEPVSQLHTLHEMKVNDVGI